MRISNFTATAVVSVLSILVGNMQAGSGPDACNLMSPQDVASVLGSNYQPIPAGKGLGICGYMKGKDTAAILVLGPVDDAALGLQQMHDSFQKAGRSVTSVPDLGTSAFYDIYNGKITLNFGKGHWWAQVSVQTGGKANVDATIKLARVALSRWP
jgi:hypothetical protein